ncbi:hypothetical protein DFJ74DRAFT_708645 [Hyaloraphidium curvatum]|nr:hypothetical protein DFJ74DRAFT_708645 [Hyaloraphidium curvatum]
MGAAEPAEGNSGSVTRRAKDYSRIFKIVVLMPAAVAGVIVNAATGSCIPAYLVIESANILAFHAIPLLDAAASNAGLDALVGLYRGARSRLIRLLADSSADALHSTSLPDPALPAVRKLVSDHADLLLSFESLSAYRATFLGFAVEFGTLRALAAGLFTVGVGLWSVFRGAGVGVVMDVFCPA